ncbi:MAG: hypothetical protein AB7E42_09125 [Anaerotignaceae bacterium]
MDNKKKLIHIVVCLVVCGFILSLRHAFIFPEEIVSVSRAIFDDITGVIVAFRLMDIVRALENIPWSVITSSFCFISFGIGYLILKSKPKTMKIGSAIFSEELVKVIKRGLFIYLMRAMLIFVFIYSVVGIPVAVAIIFITKIVDIVGMVPVAVNIGSSIQETINGNDRRIEYNYIIGAIAMLISSNVYAVGCALFLFVFPVLSFGTVSCMIEKKVFCMPIDTSEFEKKKDKFDKNKIRDIITKGLN